MSQRLTLTNPHSVLAALQTRPQDVVEVSVAAGGRNDAWRAVADAARTRGKRLGGGRAGAEVMERPATDRDALFADGTTRAGGRGLWLALDCVQDPRNVGAVFRSAAFFGVQGVLLTRDRSAPLTGVAYDAACGGLEHVPHAWVGNLARDLRAAKDAGLWILGAAEQATTPLERVPRDRPWLLVLGNEESGLRRLTRETCDELFRIPARGPVGTLNVSNAAAVAMAALTAPP